MMDGYQQSSGGRPISSNIVDVSELWSGSSGESNQLLRSVSRETAYHLISLQGFLNMFRQGCCSVEILESMHEIIKVMLPSANGISTRNYHRDVNFAVDFFTELLSNSNSEVKGREGQLLPKRWTFAEWSSFLSDVVEMPCVMAGDGVGRGSRVFYGGAKAGMSSPKHKKEKTKRRVKQRWSRRESYADSEESSGGSADSSSESRSGTSEMGDSLAESEGSGLVRALKALKPNKEVVSPGKFDG